MILIRRNIYRTLFTYICNFILFLHILPKLAQVPSRLETITFYRNCENQKIFLNTIIKNSKYIGTLPTVMS